MAPTRKSYVTPTLTRHGDAAEKTLGGLIGGNFEYWGWRRYFIP